MLAPQGAAARCDTKSCKVNSLCVVHETIRCGCAARPWQGCRGLPRLSVALVCRTLVVGCFSTPHRAGRDRPGPIARAKRLCVVAAHLEQRAPIAASLRRVWVKAWPWDRAGVQTDSRRERFVWKREVHALVAVEANDLSRPCLEGMVVPATRRTLGPQGVASKRGCRRDPEVDLSALMEVDAVRVREPNTLRRRRLDT